VRSPAAAGPLEADGPGEPVRADGRLGTESPVRADGRLGTESPVPAAGRLGTESPVPAAGRLGTESPVPAAGASDAEWVAERAASGDALAEAAIRTAAEALGRGVATLVDLLNPELVVVGGGVADAGEVLLRPLRASLADHGLPDSLAPVVASDLGALAELRGAIRLAMDAASTTMVVERAATARG
jgi:glucokinase